MFHWAAEHIGGHWLYWSALFSAALMMATGLAVRRSLVAANGGVIPDEGFSFRNVIELIVDFLVGMVRDNLGPKWRTYFPLIGTLFFFILFSNLFGLIPGIDGATSDANTTWAWALISFGAHQYVGIKENGFKYIHHFLGPVMFEIKGVGIRPLAPLYAPIEVIGHLARAFTLAIRLLANMFADHTVVGVFLGLVPIVVPAIFMGLGVMVAFLQAFVFAMLSVIYISLALEHEEH
jgi:F-type H+-transporting ATPase subunit a